MSQENVEIVKQVADAFAEKGVEGAIPFFTDDIVIYSIPGWPDDSEYRGHDGLRRLNRQWTDNFDEFGLDLQTKGSAIPMRMQIGAVFSGFSGGRVAQQRLFSSWGAALEAAGLSE